MTERREFTVSVPALRTRPMYVRMHVTEEERALIRKAAQQPGWSVSTWATVNLVQLAEIETAGEKASPCP